MLKTVSLETAKQLKEAGFNQNNLSLYFRKYWRITSSGAEAWYDLNYSQDMSELDFSYSYAAPTTDELLEELPSMIRLKEADYYLWITRIKDRTLEVRYADSRHEGHLSCIFQNKLLSEALAAMWLLLNQQGLIERGKG